MRKEKRFYPALLDALHGYSLPVFIKDLQAGVIVGVVALPLAIAFAIASGVSPQTGIITAILAGFIISVMGGSTVQIGGPTGAFVVIVAGIVQQHGVSGLIMATFLAGILLILMGLAKLGTVIRFIPYPLIVGFTSGIALIIALTQVRDALGLKIENIPGELPGRLHAYITHIATVNWYSTAITICTILLLIYWPRITHKIPGSLIALLFTTVLVQSLHLPVETIADRFGQISSVFPNPHFTMPDFDTFRKLFQPAIAIALLGAIESLLSAVVADGMTGKRHHSNTELVAQGTANIFSSLFGGIPATGAIARTATNIRNGAQTPIAGIIHAITLLLILLFLGKWAALVPMATLAGILIIVAYNMSEWQHFKAILKGSGSDVIVLIATFLLTVLFDLTVAIETGIILALIFFVRNLVKQSDVISVTNADGPQVKRNFPPDVEVFEIEGPLFFGAVYKFTDAIRQIENPPRVLILRMKHVPLIDATGIKALKDALRDCNKRKTRLVLSDITNEKLMDELRRSRLLFAIGKANVTDSFEAALKRSSEL